MPEKTVFLYGHVLRAFFYAQAHAQSATPCTWKSAAKAAHRPRDEQEENLPCPIFTGKIVLLENDVGLPALFLHPELINNEIHCAHF